MGRQQRIAGRFGSHLAVTQDEVGQDGEHCFASRALNTPDGEPAQSHPGIMGVTGQTTATVTGRFVGELKAHREDEGQDKLNKCFAIAEQLEVGGLIVEIDGEGAILAFGLVSLWHVSSPFVWRWVGMRHREDNVLKDQANCERIGASPLNALECGF
jgi:hypothetical protein